MRIRGRPGPDHHPEVRRIHHAAALDVGPAGLAGDVRIAGEVVGAGRVENEQARWLDAAASIEVRTSTSVVRESGLDCIVPAPDTDVSPEKSQPFIPGSE